MTGRSRGPRCGNAVPRSQWPQQTRDVVDQFEAYLRWAAADPATRGPAPAEVDPTGYDRKGNRLEWPTRPPEETNEAPN